MCSNSSSIDCFWNQVNKDHKCLHSCVGLYSDIEFKPNNKDSFEDAKYLEELQKEYDIYKSTYAENLVFDRTKDDYSKYSKVSLTHNFE